MGETRDFIILKEWSLSLGGGEGEIRFCTSLCVGASARIRILVRPLLPSLGCPINYTDLKSVKDAQ